MMGDLAKAMDAYNAGKLEEAGVELGLEPVAKKYGHTFDESNESYRRRLAAALGLPEEPEGAGAAEVAPPVESAPAKPVAPPEAEPEEQAEEEELPHSPQGRRRRRT